MRPNLQEQTLSSILQILFNSSAKADPTVEIGGPIIRSEELWVINHLALYTRDESQSTLILGP
jgi:hypothetical protein